MPAMMIHHHPFVKTLARDLRRRCGISEHARVLVAVSGGADSTALLRALAALAPRRGWGLKLAVGHVLHFLRSEEETQLDAGLVRELAQSLSIPMVSTELNGQELKHASNTEALARQRRYEALREMGQYHRAAFIATAHHADDQLETLLMRMLRGTSVQGLRGIAWRRCISRDGEDQALLIRPMLRITHKQALTFLRDIDQPWREDHTNRDKTRLRARLRHDVLPVLADIRSDAAVKATALAGHFRQVQELLDQQVRLASDKVAVQENGRVLDRKEARQLPRLVLTGLLRRVLTELGVAEDRLTNRSVGAIVRAINDTQGGERRFDLAGATVVVTGVAVRATHT